MAVRQDIRQWKFHGLQNIFCNGVQRLQQRFYPVIIEDYPWFKAVQKFNAVLQLFCKNKIRKSYKSIKILQTACTLSQMEVQLLVRLCIILLTYRQIIKRAKVTKHQRIFSQFQKNTRNQNQRYSNLLHSLKYDSTQQESYCKRT